MSNNWKFVALLMILALLGFSNSEISAVDVDSQFTKNFRLEDCHFKAEGVTSYFILKPGYQLVLEGEEDGKTVRFIMSVLTKTKTIDVPNIGKVTTRIVEEKEWADGKPIEFAESYFAICEETGDVYDFGDKVDIFNEDGTVSHDGTWLVGTPDKDGLAEPGIFMPGTFLLGAKYFQQLADGLSMERAENSEMGLKIQTKAGTFENCVRVMETNSVEEQVVATAKTHCPGIGLVGEDTLMLIKYGYHIADDNGKLGEKS